MNTTGVYVLSYPGDYHLALPLVESIKQFAPGVPIMVIPGEGVDRHDHPFDVPVMPEPEGYWAKQGHCDRKFWAFQGPFERFVYLDADIICTRPLAPLIEHIETEQGRFLSAYIRVETGEWNTAVADPEHPLHAACISRVRAQHGDVDLLKEFDPDYSPYSHYPFNAGLFASTRLAIDEEAFANLYAREVEFFDVRLKKPFRFDDHSLFFADQGRLNYLVEQLGIELKTLFPYGHYEWGGEAFSLSVETALRGEAPYSFIHWAGTARPSPSLFCRMPLLRLLPLAYELPPEYRRLHELPGYSLWRHFADRRWDARRLGGTSRWTRKDAASIVRRSFRRLVKRCLRLLGLARRRWDEPRADPRRII